MPPKKMTPEELYTHVQSITDQMDKKEREVFYEEAEKEAFKLEKWIDADFSVSWCLFCNSGHNKIKIFIYLDFDQWNRRK